MSLGKVVKHLPVLKLSYATGRPLSLPVNLTVSVSYRCNSRCKTCNVWLLPNDDFTIEEYDRTFASLGRTPYWFTFSGGEPTLRADLPDMVASAYKHCRPGIINIPTNGIQDKIIPGRIADILERCPESNVVINLSLDAVGEKHDHIRGVPGNFQRAMRTFQGLKSLKPDHPNLTVGVHTVISNFNLEHFPELCTFVEEELQPDSFISEIAEQRVELDTVGLGITPSLADYSGAIDRLRRTVDRQEQSGLPRITQAFREQYYEIVKRTLTEKRQVIPCMAGVASAQISPNGDVWSCCIRAEPMGNLREHGYNFGAVWRSREAGELRRSIKAGECYCPLANASYTNMLLHAPTFAKVLSSVAVGG